MIRHPPYSPDLAPADYFLFPKVKSALAGKHINEGSIKKSWDGVTGTIAADEWIGAFEAWMHCAEKCILKEGDFVRKK